MWHILRKISIRVTWAFLHIPINANGVTFLFILTGIGICLVFLQGTKPAFFIGALSLQFWYVLDLVDGEVARYRKQSVATGRFFDYMAHYIVHPWFFIAIGFGLYRSYGNLAIFLCSILAGYSVHLVEVLLDVYNSVLYRRLKSKLLDPAKEIVFKRMEEGGRGEKNNSLIKRCFSFLHYVSTFPVIIYIMLPFSIINLFIRAELFIPWILFYACAATLVWVGRVTFFIMHKKIDLEYTQIDNALTQWRGQK
jgi:hypothetical protein